MPRFLINIIFILTFFQTVGQNRNTAGGGQSYTYDNIYATRSYDKEDKFLGSTYLFSEWNNNGIFYVQGKSYRIDNIDAVEGTFNLAKEPMIKQCIRFQIGILLKKEMIFYYLTQVKMLF